MARWNANRVIVSLFDPAKDLHVELVAVMAQYNPFAERAGMKLIQRSEPHPSVPRAVDELRNLGFDPVRLASVSHNLERLEALSDVDGVREILSRLASQYYKRVSRQQRPYVRKGEYLEWLEKQPRESLARAVGVLGVLNQVKAYLYWCRDWLEEDGIG